MKAKLVIIVAVLLICCGVLFSISYKNGFNVTGASNPVSEFSTISELQQSVRYTFQVPEAVANDKLISLNNYMGEMVEIQSENYRFTAAPFVNYDVDASGDYSDFDIDNKYISTDSSIYVRYRGRSSKTIVSLKISDIAYSIEMNKQITEDEALKLFGINKDGLNTFELSANEDVANTDKDTNTNNVTENNTNNEELTFKVFKDESYGISFMIPNISSEIRSVYTNDTLTLFLGTNIVYEIYKVNSENQEFSGYTTAVINDEYAVRYILNNDFEKGTTMYYDYYTLIENIDTVVNTFKHD